MKIRPVERELFHAAGRTNGYTWRSYFFSENSQISWKSVQWNASCSMRPDERMDINDEAKAKAPNKPQAAVNMVLHCASFIAVLTTTGWQNLPAAAVGALGHKVSAALLWDCFSFYTSQPLPCFRSSLVLRGGGWYLFTDVSKQPIDPIFKDPAAKVGSFYLPEDWNNKLCPNVSKWLLISAT